MAEQNIDRMALRKISCGVYIVSSILDQKMSGQIANTVFQVTSDPPRIAISISKNNLTHEYILKSGFFSISVVDESATMTQVGLFGFRSGRVIDKFSQTTFKVGVTGCPIVTENTSSAVEAKVIEKIDIGTHTLFIGDVVSAEILAESKPMTYAYYQENLRGKTPVDSPTFIPLK